MPPSICAYQKEPVWTVTWIVMCESILCLNIALTMWTLFKYNSAFTLGKKTTTKMTRAWVVPTGRQLFVFPEFNLISRDSWWIITLANLKLFVASHMIAIATEKSKTRCGEKNHLVQDHWSQQEIDVSICSNIYLAAWLASGIFRARLESWRQHWSAQASGTTDMPLI